MAVGMQFVSSEVVIADVNSYFAVFEKNYADGYGQVGHSLDIWSTALMETMLRNNTDFPKNGIYLAFF